MDWLRIIGGGKPHPVVDIAMLYEEYVGAREAYLNFLDTHPEIKQYAHLFDRMERSRRRFIDAQVYGRMPKK